jgi:hypothetical protein
MENEINRPNYLTERERWLMKQAFTFADWEGRSFYDDWLYEPIYRSDLKVIDVLLKDAPLPTDAQIAEACAKMLEHRANRAPHGGVVQRILQEEADKIRNGAFEDWITDSK